MQKLFDLFDSIGLPYHRQGSLANREYPPSFFTFWNVDTQPTKHRDNKLIKYDELVQIGFYTNDASQIYSQLDVGGEFYQKIQENNKYFEIAEMPQDADADEDNFFGRVCLIRITHNV